MNKYIVTLTAALALTAATLPSFADDKSDIKALYVKYAAECRRNTYFGTNASRTDSGQTVNATTMKQQTKSSGTTASCTVEAYDIKVTGKTATSKSKMHVVTMVQVAANGKTSKIDSFYTGDDAFEKKADGWRFKKGTSTLSKLTKDGKPFDPSKMASPPAPNKK